jgi:putative endonuclease
MIKKLSTVSPTGGREMIESLGLWGERRAVEYLLRDGYRILEKNFRVWEGEIDIIAEKDDAIVFVEVKTRSSRMFGSPEQSLVSKKQAALIRAGYKFLEKNQLMGRIHQFDLIAIECTANRKLTRLSHYENIIGGDMLT